MVPRTILVAEDNEDDVLLLKRAFAQSQLNVRIHFVGDGEEAIAYMQGNGRFSQRAEYPLPQLIVTDLKMPKVTGFGFLAWLREQAQTECTPVIVLTTSSDEQEVKKAYQMGANSFVTKPHGYGDLEDLVATLHRFWLRFNRLPET